MKPQKIFLLLFLSSFSTLAYEISLTRIFSISIGYHFAFMIISIAMLGIGTSGTLLSIYPKLKNPSNFGLYSLLLGVSIAASYLLSNRIPFDPARLSFNKLQILYIGLYYLTLSIPFLLFGLIVATAVSSLSEKSGFLYGADLLGGGAGSIGVISLLYITAPERVVFLLSSTALFASFIAGGKKNKVVTLILIALNFVVFFLHPDFVKLRISPYKGLEVALRYPGAMPLKTYYSPFSRVDIFKSPIVRFAPGLSLKYLEPLPEQLGFSIDGGEINAITATGDQKTLSFLKYLPSALPYEIGKKEDTLIIDPKGGLQVLVAEKFNAKNIFKVESNPFLIKVILDELSPPFSQIYSNNTWTGLGRSWLRPTNRKFDIIDIPLTNAVPSGSFGISEEYRFSVEAFREYFEHLKDTGILSINLFILPPPRIELRLLSTMITALTELGIVNVERHIAAVRSWGNICIIAKKTPFIEQEIEGIKKFSKTRRFDLIYYLGITEEETNRYIRMPANEYFTAFRNILNNESREEFISNYIFDIRPVRDDAPFFHHYFKLKNIQEIYYFMGEKWQYFIEEGYLLPVVFIQVFLFSMLLILLPAIANREGRTLEKRKGNRLLLFYFAFLGMGFMFVEISLIQKVILTLETPSYAVAAIITSILISSGIGSLLSYRVQGLRSPIVTLIISLTIVVYNIILPALSGLIASKLIIVKFFVIILCFIPLGFFMGIPFPTGLRVLGERHKSMIPWAWAINGCFSVLTPILTIMLAMVLGFSAVMYFGALAYLTAFAIQKRAV